MNGFDKLNIMFQVRRTKRQLAKTTQSSCTGGAASQNTENRIASIVMVIVTVFVICNMAETTFCMLASQLSVFSAIKVIPLMVSLNSSANPYVYGFFSEYRKLFCQLFLPSINK